MTSPRDEIDEWLDREVSPLSPQPGSLDRIRRRARQRKQRQAVVAAVGCAVVIGAAAAVPQLISAGTGSPAQSRPAIAGSQSPPSLQPSASSTGSSPSSPLEGRATQLHQRTQLTTGTSGTVPPLNFQPTSVTFVGTGTGSVVGAVIGQAGQPGHCATADCTSLAGTSNYGQSWYGVSAPVAPGESSAAGVSQLRFASLTNGWAFGPALYETSHGGWPWVREDTYGHRVIDVEAAGQSALAIFASCSGDATIPASDCTSFSLYSSVAGSMNWTPVNIPAGYEQRQDGQASSASLVISGGSKTAGYLLTPTGMLLTGPVSGGTWITAGQAPCETGSAWPSGAPTGAQLAAGPDQQLLLTCDTATGIVLYTSTGGKTWSPAGTVPARGSPMSLATGTPGQVVLATNSGIYYSANTGKTWQAARIAGGRPGGGFSFVGMTDATQGVAIPTDAGIGAIYVTSDAGKTWTRSPITG